MSDRIKKECELKLSNNSIFGGLKCNGKFEYIFSLFLDYSNKFLCIISVPNLNDWNVPQFHVRNVPNFEVGNVPNFEVGTFRTLRLGTFRTLNLGTVYKL